ncbi:MAG: sugar ABC transporter ATP-binding protein [Actinobacteria bacterium]|nr:sugar ABC transporter ATP-binding protein [Actinomycetota bacterium]
MNNLNLLEIINISKSFGGTKALNDVNFKLEKGEVHALIGQNGAGKSTLSRIIAGDIQKDTGKIFIEGIEVNIRNPLNARNLGICMIYQELRLIPYLTVAENIFLNQYSKNKLSLISWKNVFKRAQDLMDKWDIRLDRNALIKDLPIAQQQLVEILKSLSLNPRIIIMDEPTSSLGCKEVEALFNLIDYLKNNGVSIIYISHILDEVFKISNRITVLRDGKICGTFATRSVEPKEIINLMLNETSVGEQQKTIERKITDETLLEVKNLKSGNLVNDVSFNLKKGEILGITGLLGSGKTELANCIFGLRKIDSGEIILKNRKVRFLSPNGAIKNRIGLIPEDRRKHGIFSIMSIRDNLSFLVLRCLKRFGLISSRSQNKVTKDYAAKLSIKFDNYNQTLNELSGGNQQKVVISRWLTIEPEILIADEPTRGIDVGTKKEIYLLLKRIANSGTGLIILSEEIEEIMELSDRIMVLSKGKIKKEYEDNKVNKNELTLCVTGLEENIN